MLFDKLTEEDKNLIINYIEEYGRNEYSQVYRIHKPLDYLLRFWEGSKEDYLYTLMGKNLILEKEISYSTPKAKLEDQIYRACERGKPMHDFYRAYAMKMKERFNISYWGNDFYAYDSLIRYANLANNKINNIIEPHTFDFGEGIKVKIEQTTKPMRALGKIAKIIGEEESFERFRLEHSRILNQKKLEGVLCLSIHPMDYLTMSDNASNWTSCMSWSSGGGYRMGTVEMMNSNCVIVGYLKSQNSSYYGWNDKHWRSLFIASPDIIASVKGYPYGCDELSQMCVEWIKELGIQNLNWNNFGEISEIFESKAFQYKDNNWYYFIPETGIMYNDFGCATHWGVIPMKTEVSTTETDYFYLRLYYSGITECMCCGARSDEVGFYDESYVYCDECCSNGENERQCERCGSWWDYDDMYYVEDSYYCPDCIDDIAAVSCTDGCYYYRRNLIKVYLAAEKNNPDCEEDAYAYMPCEYASTDWALGSAYSNIKHPNRNETGIYYFNQEDLTDFGLRRWFEIYNSKSYFK